MTQMYRSKLGQMNEALDRRSFPVAKCSGFVFLNQDLAALAFLHVAHVETSYVDKILQGHSSCMTKYES